MQGSAIASQTEFWSIAEIQLLFGPVPEHELRRMIAGSGITAAGWRPPAGRGRPRHVYPAAEICDLLGPLSQP